MGLATTVKLSPGLCLGDECVSVSGVGQYPRAPANVSRMDRKSKQDKWDDRDTGLGAAGTVMVYPPVLHVPLDPRSHLRWPDPFPTLSDRPPTPLGRQSASHSLSQTLVCFYYPSLLDTLNSP